MAYTTRKSMLDGMRRNAEAAWEEFRATYAPLIQLTARRKNLTEQESDELLQEVCVTMYQRHAIEKYDPAKGRFRTYLGRIVSNCAVDLIRKRPVAQPVSTRHLLNAVEEGGADTEEIHHEWEEFLLERALAELRARYDDVTFLAFEFHVRQHRPAKEVAAALGISEQKVYLSGSRLARHLKESVERMGKELEKP